MEPAKIDKISSAIVELIETLPKDAKLAVLDHLLGEIGAKDIRNISSQARAELLKILDGGEKAPELKTIKIHEVREIMGDHLIGPEAYKKFFGAKDLGEIPPIPAHITKELLSQKCELTQDGRTQHTSTIAETHRLVFIPAKIDGDPFTIMKLANLAEPAGATLGRPEMFYDTSWYKNEPFANTPKEKGEWLLVPMTILPDSRGKSYNEQNAQLQKYPDYRGASFLEFVTTLIMNDLALQPKREAIGAYYNTYGRCTDLSASGGRVYVGNFNASGLGVGDAYDGYRYDFLGRAVVRK